MLEPAVRSGHWRATYRFDQPASGLEFDRPAGFFRERTWEVVTPGWQLSRAGDRQRLAAMDPGAAAGEVVVEFPVFTDVLPKEYEFFTAFTDGSVAIYSGHLSASVLTSGAAVAADAARRASALEVRPPVGAAVAVRGVVAEDTRLWTDIPADGTYVYVGGIAPVESNDVVAILDPGAPRWLLAQLETALPEALEAYRVGFAEALPAKPTVLLNFEDVAQSGLSSGGGTLTGLIQMSASGTGWQDDTPRAREQLLGLIAHEAAHMWNGQLHVSRDPSDSWMHEGSADAFAADALMRAGAIDAARLAERRTRALNACAAGLAGGPLSDSGDRQAFQNYYTCGEMIAVWSVAATVEREASLFALWRDVMKSTDEPYDRASYFAALRAGGATPEAVDALQRFIDESHPDPALALTDLFAVAGVALQHPARPAPDARPGRAVLAMRHVMGGACDGHMSFSLDGDAIRTDAIETCRAFDRPLAVVSLESHRIEDGDLAYAAVHARCSARDSIRFGLEAGGSHTVPCVSPPPPAPRPLAFPLSVR